MTAQDINAKALTYLSNGDWTNAQALLFENAKRFPSYQTYNNLGYFLITEGLTCKNGKSRNALNLGVKYLQGSSELKATAVNLCALVKYVDYKLRGADESGKPALYSYACECLKRALSLEYTDELQYNFLLFSYMAESGDRSIVGELRELLNKFVAPESVSLYFEALRHHSMIDEGLECIGRYGDFLDEVDLLMFYAKCGAYENGYQLCDAVYRNFIIFPHVAAAIIECCTGTSRPEEARKYASLIKESAESGYPRQKNQLKEVLADPDAPMPYRKALIAEYKCAPSMIERCCYFGCKEHGVSW